MRDITFYVFILYSNLDLDDWIYECLQTSMAAVQSDDVCFSFLFVGNLNGHLLEFLGSLTTNRHGVPAYDFATVSGYDQLVVFPTPACGGTHNLSIDVHDLVWVAIVTPIGNRRWRSFRWDKLF